MNKAALHEDSGQKRSFGCLHLAGIALLAALVAASASAWWVKHYLYASLHRPTELTVTELEILDTKVGRLEAGGSSCRGLSGKTPPGGRSARSV
jgi:hypothetical protein